MSQARKCRLSLTVSRQSHGAKSICDEQDDMELGTPYIVALGPADCFFIAGRSTQNAPVWKYSLPPGSRDRIQIWERSDDKECMRHPVSGSDPRL